MKPAWTILPLLLLAACATDKAPPAPPPAVIEVGIGESCGGFTRPGRMCAGAPETAYCRYEPAAMCGAADAPGTCQPRPQVCTREYRPVCGCDRRTYGNACTAASAGVSVVHEGACHEG
ncbi:Kazal-type serine protease inhibitor family protein [Maricaulis sp.]|uniref:Kazal-type serine protease inhibitor family protein n=1 Tax=Maricaulis sp. TaxID=1486257 RepID=UPI0026342A30|nr:Kazal-type serine protease inhibitor family protein [Maricaulis sp.]